MRDTITRKLIIRKRIDNMPRKTKHNGMKIRVASPIFAHQIGSYNTTHIIKKYDPISGMITSYCGINCDPEHIVTFPLNRDVSCANCRGNLIAAIAIGSIIVASNVKISSPSVYNSVNKHDYPKDKNNEPF